MSQMLLPQGSASAISEQAAGRPAKNRESGQADSGNSRYQDVCREHTQEMARQEPVKNRSAADQPTIEDSNADAQKTTVEHEKTAAAESAGNDKKNTDADSDNQPAADENSSVDKSQSDGSWTDVITNPPLNAVDDADITSQTDVMPVALTFMDLQAMLVPTGSVPGAAGGAMSSVAAASLTAASAGAMPAAAPGTPGQALNPLAASGTIKTAAEGSAIGLALDSAFAETRRSGESLRPLDSTSLVADSRLQSSADSLLPQPSNAARLQAQVDPALALRGYTTSVNVPVGQADWGDKVMGKLSWLTARNMSVAEIHLSPADLGPMEVKVRMHNEQASVTVQVANPMVRDQLEQHSHRLRDMLSEQGLSLEQFDVSDQARQQSAEQGDSSADRGAGNNPNNAEGPAAASSAHNLALAAGQLDLSWRGEVDVFA